MAYMVQVFTLPVDEMTRRGDFFAAMFVVLAGVCLFSYYMLGWGTNTLAQVSTRHYLQTGTIISDCSFPDSGTQSAKTNIQ
jgi:hypothetical protein